MNMQIVSTIIIVSNKGKFLLVRRDLNDDIFPGKWQNTGGKVEQGETIEQAAQRELREETGLVIAGSLRFVMSYSWQKAPDEPTRLGVIMLTDVPTQTKNLKVTLNDELCEYGWFSLGEAELLDSIGKDSPTGTLGQLKKASEVLHHL